MSGNNSGGSNASALDCAMDLMRRLPPQKVERNLANLIELVPHLTEELLNSVDQPLSVARDPDTGKDYLLCDYNRDGDSYRSPWTNRYWPALEDGGALPTEKLRALETEMNSAFEIYKNLYYDGGISSVYMWDLEAGFAGVVLIKKAASSPVASSSGGVSGCWDSIHVVEVQEKSGGRLAHYKLTSTVMLWLEEKQSGEGGREKRGCFNLGGSLTRANEKEAPLNQSDPTHSAHVANIGKLVEDTENTIRKQLNDIYFGTTKNVINSLRSDVSREEEKKRDKVIKEMNVHLKSSAASK